MYMPSRNQLPTSTNGITCWPMMTGRFQVFQHTFFIMIDALPGFFFFTRWKMSFTVPSNWSFSCERIQALPSNDAVCTSCPASVHHAFVQWFVGTSFALIGSASISARKALHIFIWIVAFINPIKPVCANRCSWYRIALTSSIHNLTSELFERQFRLACRCRDTKRYQANVFLWEFFDLIGAATCAVKIGWNSQNNIKFTDFRVLGQTLVSLSCPVISSIQLNDVEMKIFCVVIRLTNILSTVRQVCWILLLVLYGAAALKVDSLHELFSLEGVKELHF